VKRVTHLKEKRNACPRKGLFETPLPEQWDNIKINLNENKYRDVNWMYKLYRQRRVVCCAKQVMEFHGTIKCM
jgi:hypothetical protein